MRNSGPPSPAETASRREERREAAVIALVAVPMLLVLLFVAFAVFRFFTIPAGSMVPALPVGSTVLVSRLAYGFTRHTFDWFELQGASRWPHGEIKRGDIITFRKSHDRSTVFVKRVIGLSGDRVAMRAGRLVINGETVPREPAGDVPDPLRESRPIPSYIETLPGGVHVTVLEAEGDDGMLDNTDEVTVPPESLFVMGDNRDNSADSRVMSDYGVGFVAIDNVVGKVVLTF